MGKSNQRIYTSDDSVCFPPASERSAKVLILGSFPGVMSLEKQQYYAHPRNSFWNIMEDIVGLKKNGEYETRLKQLQDAGIALWDVLYSCSRAGSLDASIDSSTIRVNDFETFFNEHPHLRAIFFNGRRAEQEFTKRVLKQGEAPFDKLVLTCLPSTSPAMASLNYKQKSMAWSVIKDYLI